MVRHSSKMLILGSLLVIFSLMLMFQPLFTWAQVQNDDHPCQISVDPEDDLFDLGNLNPGDSYTRTVKVTKTGSACANLYLTWDYIRGTPVLGKPGSLFEQLDLLIWETDRNGNRLRKVYEGKMSGAPQYFEARWIAFMQYGDVVYLEITVSLPGPETGNEFQGSHLLTKLVFYTACCDEPDKPDRPAINIEKFTNGVDADLPTGPFIPVGGAVTWTYVVTNTGNVPLSNVQVTDNRAGVKPVYVSGDTNGDGILQVGETWLYRATGVAVAGQYSNIGKVVGTPPTGPNVTDSDPSHYFGVTAPPTPAPPTLTPPAPTLPQPVVPPESPKVAPPLPRTDGFSVGLFIAGALFILIGAMLRKNVRQEFSKE